MCSGGAARNMRIAQQGGLSAVENKAAIHALQYIQALVNALQQQLEESRNLNQQLAALITELTPTTSLETPRAFP